MASALSWIALSYALSAIFVALTLTSTRRFGGSPWLSSSFLTFGFSNDEILYVLSDHPHLRLLRQARLPAFAIAGLWLFGHLVTPRLRAYPLGAR